MSTPVVTDEMVEAAMTTMAEIAQSGPATWWTDRTNVRTVLQASGMDASQPVSAAERRQIGSDLRAWRMEREVSLRDVADDCGTRPSVVSSYEFGYWDVIDPTVLLALGLYIPNQEAQATT